MAWRTALVVRLVKTASFDWPTFTVEAHCVWSSVNSELAWMIERCHNPLPADGAGSQRGERTRVLAEYGLDGFELEEA